MSGLLDPFPSRSVGLCQVDNWERKLYHRDAERTQYGDHRALTERIIGCAIEVHRALGPGLRGAVDEGRSPRAWTVQYAAI